VLWREPHPEGHEQVALNFGVLSGPATNVMLLKKCRRFKLGDIGRKKLAKD
jgi:hypothetical protein